MMTVDRTMRIKIDTAERLKEVAKREGRTLRMQTEWALREWLESSDEAQREPVCAARDV